MATVRTTCPYCNRQERLSIGPVFDAWDPMNRRPWLWQVMQGYYPNTDREFVAALECHLCGGSSLGVFASDAQGQRLVEKDSQAVEGIEKNHDHIVLVHTFPATDAPSAPDGIPSPAAIFYVEAKEDLQRERSPAGVISKCRSVLDLCLKELGAQGKTRRLRIADLRAKGLLTESLAAWAGELWDDGNDAIHDLTGDADKARQHVAFLELFFEVAFTLPRQIALAQQQPPDS